MNISEADKVLITEALSDLLEEIQQNIPYLKNISTDMINMNTLAIASAKIKLGKINKIGAAPFEPQEIKVIIWSLSLLKKGTVEFLDSVPLSDPDREPAVETQKACNRILRELRQQLPKEAVEELRKLPFV